MTLRPSSRRDDPSIQLGGRHGYRFEGDHAFINADILVPPHHSGGEWTLELWATEPGHREGALIGDKVAELALELPTPIGPYVHRVDARVPARLPLQGRAYAMVLALVQHGADAPPTVQAFAGYPELQRFSAPRLEGAVGYRVQGAEVVLEAEGIVNPRDSDNLSGTLSLELWAFPVDHRPADGVRLASAAIEPVAGQTRLDAFQRCVAFSEPPTGRSQLALLLCEWTFAHGYVPRDRRDFPRIYERAAPVVPGATPAGATGGVAPQGRPIERLRLVPTVDPEVSPEVSPGVLPGASPEILPEVSPEASREGSEDRAEVSARTEDPAAAAPVVAVAAPVVVSSAVAAGLVSIQTGSVEELARVKGLNAKLAKEIVKARPFASIADLIRVRGLGQKSIDRLKGLVTL